MKSQIDKIIDDISDFADDQREYIRKALDIGLLHSSFRETEGRGITALSSKNRDIDPEIAAILKQNARLLGIKTLEDLLVRYCKEAYIKTIVDLDITVDYLKTKENTDNLMNSSARMEKSQKEFEAAVEDIFRVFPLIDKRGFKLALGEAGTSVTEAELTKPYREMGYQRRKMN